MADSQEILIRISIELDDNHKLVPVVDDESRLPDAKQLAIVSGTDFQTLLDWVILEFHDSPTLAQQVTTLIYKWAKDRDIYIRPRF